LEITQLKVRILAVICWSLLSERLCFPGKEFDRKNYQLLPWLDENGEKSITGPNQYKLIESVDCYGLISADKAGSFHFYFAYEENGYYTFYFLFFFYDVIFFLIFDTFSENKMFNAVQFISKLSQKSELGRRQPQK
jgi:hypothetical protein